MTLQAQRNTRKPYIADGRAYRVLDAHYRIRWRLQGVVWKGPLVDALLKKRDEGWTLRVAVARMYRQLKRLETGHEQCDGQDDRGAHGAGAGPAVLRHAGAAAGAAGERAQ